MDRLSWALADGTTVETPQLARELSDLTPRKSLVTVPYGIPESRWSGGTARPVDLLYVGTSGNRKRTHLLPMILKRVRDRVPGAQLRIVGFTKDQDQQLVAEAERLDVSSAITFSGPVRSEEVVGHYRSARVLVLPSAYEGLPLVLLEAMREGLVAVATNVSGHPEAIEDGINGYLVDVDDVESMADRCAGLLIDSSKRRAMMNQASRLIASRFPADAQIRGYEQVYLKLLGMSV